MASGRHVVVIGAGVAGLAAARRLRAAGHAVTVLEREPAAGGELKWLPVDATPPAMPLDSASSTSISFVDRCPTTVSISWVDFQGRARHYADVPAGGTHVQPTFVGHVWLVAEGTIALGSVVAESSPGVAYVQ